RFASAATFHIERDSINIQRLTALVWFLHWSLLEPCLYLLRKLLENQIVSSLYERLQFFFTQRVETFQRNPMVSGRVGRGNDAVSFDQLGEFFRRRFKRHAVIGTGIETDYRKHFAADLEDEIGAPLNILSGMRERQAVG